MTDITPDVLRAHAEQQYADELAALAAADDRPRPPQLAALARGRWRRTCSAATLRRRHGRSRRSTSARGGSIEIAVAIAGHRPGAAAARRARHRQDLGRRAPRGRDQRRVDAGGAGHGGHGRRSRCATAGTTPGCWPKGPSRSALVPEPGDAGDGDRRARPGRGADPHPGRRAGRPDHDPVGEDAADPRARRRGPGAARASTSSRPRTTATRASTTCRRRCAGASTPSCCRCPTPSSRRWRSSAPGSRPSAAPLELPRRPRGAVARSSAWSRSSASCARASTADRRTTLKSPSATLSTAEAISVMTNGRRAGRPLRRRRGAGRTTSRPAWSAPSSRTRCRTGSCGRSTSRPSSRTGATGATSTGPAASSAEADPMTATVEVLGHPAPRAGLGPVRGRRPSTSCDPDLVAHRGRARARRVVELLADAGHACRRWPGSSTPSTRRAGRCSTRSRPSRRSGWRCAGRWTHGVPVRFADLPAAHQLAGRADEAATDGDEPTGGPAQAPRARPDRRCSAVARPGYDDPERWWEDAVEHRSDLVAGALRRGPGGDGRGPRARRTRSDDDPDVVENARREAAMRRRPARRDARRARERVAVRVRRLPRARAGPGDASRRGAATTSCCAGLPKTKVAATWVPWTSGRLAVAQRVRRRRHVARAGTSTSSTTGPRAGRRRASAPSWLVRVARALRERAARRVDRRRSSRRPGWPTRWPPSAAARRSGSSELDDAARGRAVRGLATCRCGSSHDALVVGASSGAVPGARADGPAGRATSTGSSGRCGSSRAATRRRSSLDLRQRDASGPARCCCTGSRLLGVAWGTRGRRRPHDGHVQGGLGARVAARSSRSRSSRPACTARPSPRAAAAKVAERGAAAPTTSPRSGGWSSSACSPTCPTALRRGGRRARGAHGPAARRPGAARRRRAAGPDLPVRRRARRRRRRRRARARRRRRPGRGRPARRLRRPRRRRRRARCATAIEGAAPRRRAAGRRGAARRRWRRSLEAVAARDRVHGSVAGRVEPAAARRRPDRPADEAAARMSRRLSVGDARRRRRRLARRLPGGRGGAAAPRPGAARRSSTTGSARIDDDDVRGPAAAAAAHVLPVRAARAALDRRRQVARLGGAGRGHRSTRPTARPGAGAGRRCAGSPRCSGWRWPMTDEAAAEVRDRLTRWRLVLGGRRPSAGRRRVGRPAGPERRRRSGATRPSQALYDGDRRGGLGASRAAGRALARRHPELLPVLASSR